MKVVVEQNNVLSVSRDRLSTGSYRSRPAGATVSHTLSQSNRLSPVGPLIGIQAAKVAPIKITRITTGMVLLGGKMLHRAAELFLLGDAMTILLGAVMIHRGIKMFLLIDGMVPPTIEMIFEGGVHPVDPGTRGMFLCKTRWIRRGLITERLSVVDKVARVPQSRCALVRRSAPRSFPSDFGSRLVSRSMMAPRNQIPGLQITWSLSSLDAAMSKWLCAPFR